MSYKKPMLALVLVVAVAAVPAPVIGALHFDLRSSSPEADATVTAPEEIRLTFTEVPQDNSVAVRLIAPSGDAVETDEPTYDAEDRTTIHVALLGALPTGAYTVSWRGIGDDGHVVRGDFGFSVTAQ
jgi:methionine-rich copper-binding protein CopC